MRETTKANQRRINEPIFQQVFSGKVADIGCGDDALQVGTFNIGEVITFDNLNGKPFSVFADEPDNSFDCIYSSHLLEHLKNPYKALQIMYNKVKTGGYICFVVPDEDLYEQGVFPSLWNKGHIHTFTINKERSWCIDSINIVDLLKLLPEHKVIKVALEATNYDFAYKGIDQTINNVEANIEVVIQKL